ncbi:hypothetical protein ZIOFF_064641 [Zingiber officinale]|uniref:Uncharacterized protein n=1 Tax=Zingiber officinale TaxID=94328 RepID=A0A8J5EW62_ZINOF|nr:hypothetical protein ZIOFF_064641 [Zingiber officinale]
MRSVVQLTCANTCRHALRELKEMKLGKSIVLDNISITGHVSMDLLHPVFSRN